MPHQPVTVSLDVGGTFTDALRVDADGGVRSYKFASADDAAFSTLFADCADAEILYSTTVALNSLLAGALPPIGLIVTTGFREVLETARLPAGAEDGVAQALPRRLVGLEWVREVSARIDADGVETAPLDVTEVQAIAHEFAAAGVGTVAVALLHSYRNPAHEQALAAIIEAAAPGCELVLSSAVLPAVREYERTLVTALNAVLIPVLKNHLDQFEAMAGQGNRPHWLMQASGGLASAARARTRPLATALAGPGAAVLGMRELAVRQGLADVITLDIGGTSTDVAVIEGADVPLTNAGSVAGFPVPLSMLDVLSIGAGGGSIAHEAPDRRWHVGPQSAGAVPGPACYGRGGSAPTLTDAELVLGRIPTALLGGTQALDMSAAIDALTRFGASRGLDAAATARGILEIASYNMCGAIRAITMRRGHKPETAVLLAMGGAGPLHAAELASLLGIGRVLVPPQPGLAAAWGLLTAAVRDEFVAPLGQLAAALKSAELEQVADTLRDRAGRWLSADGLNAADAVFTWKFDCRYEGMTHNTTVTCPVDVSDRGCIGATVAAFHDHFERLSGRTWRDREAVEVVNCRLVVTVARPAAPLLPTGAGVAPAVAERAVGFLGTSEPVVARIVARAGLAPGERIEGPAVIEQYETTLIVPPGWFAEVAADACVWLHNTTG